MSREARSDPPAGQLPDEVLGYLYSSPIFLLRRADLRAVVLFNAAVKSLPVTLPQFHALYLASEIGAMPQVELARQAAINEATASTTISHLEKRGLIERVADPDDGRRKVIVRTTAGRDLMASALPPFRQALTDLEEPLGPHAADLRALLAELVHAADGDIPHPSGLSAESAELLAMVHGSTHFLVRRAIQLFESAAYPFHAAHGVTLRQYVVLLVIALNPGIGESGIASTIGLDPSNASFISRGLRQKALVTADQTGRRRKYTINRAGYDLVIEVEPLIAVTVGRLLAHLPDAKRKALLNMLGDLIASGSLVGGVPPSFEHIKKRPDWPMMQAPALFKALLQGRCVNRQMSLADDLKKASSFVTGRGLSYDEIDEQTKSKMQEVLSGIYRHRK